MLFVRFAELLETVIYTANLLMLEMVLVGLFK